MLFFATFVVCMGSTFISAVPLNYGNHGSDISLYPVNYQVDTGNRYNLHDGGHPGSLQHVDVDNVYNGHDIVDDDKDDNRYNQRARKHQSGFNVPRQDSYDGGIEDRYNKALRDVGHNSGRRNNLFDAGVRHLSDGFDFGVSKRYDNALHDSDHGSSHGKTQRSGSGFNRKATGYSSGSKSSGSYGGRKSSSFGNNKSAAGFGNSKSATGYGNNKSASRFGNNKSFSGYGSSKNNLAKDDGFGKSTFGNDDFNFGSGGSSYHVAPHIADINFSGIRDKSSFAHPSRNIRHGNSFGNSFGNKGGQHRAVSAYPPKANTHLNSYPAETQPYSQSGRHFNGNTGHFGRNNGHFGGNNGHATGSRDHFGRNSGNFAGNNNHFGRNNGHFDGNNGHFNGNKGRFPQHSNGYTNDHRDPYTARRRTDGH